MTPMAALKADVARAEKRLRDLAAKEPRNEVALVMFEADLLRAKRALAALEEAPELRVLRGIVRVDMVEV